MKNLSQSVKFLLSLGIVIVITVVADICFGNMMEKFIKKMPDFGPRTAMNKDNYRLNKVEADVFVIGSSRAHFTYVTSILKDSINNYLSTDYSFYNAGHDAQAMNLSMCVAEGMITRHKPKIIIFELMSNELSSDGYEMNRFNPFYKSNLTAKKYIDERGIKEQIKMKSNFYRFNELIVRFVQSIQSTKPDDGYFPERRVMKIAPNMTAKNKKEETINVNNYTIQHFQRLIDRCKKENIRLIIATCPRYKKGMSPEPLQSICKQNNIPYVNMESLPYFDNHPEYFKDQAHLNDDGAQIYTRMFFEEIKQYLK